MLEHVNHPFICNLRYSFQDIEYMYERTSPPINSGLSFPDASHWRWRSHTCGNWLRLTRGNLTPYRYLVVDLMSGGDLRFHISRKTFTEEAVRFWIAELGCALRYVHGQGIIHRDVKPDNVLLDADGHVHLTDFVSPLNEATHPLKSLHWGPLLLTNLRAPTLFRTLRRT